MSEGSYDGNNGSTMEVTGGSAKVSPGDDIPLDSIRQPWNFAHLSKITMRLAGDELHRNFFYSKYNKEDIQAWLKNPEDHQRDIRNALRYIYSASTHFRRLIQYFTSLTSFSYIVEPYNIDKDKVNRDRFKSNYRKVLDALSSMNIVTQGKKILTVCLREDVYYGTIIAARDSISIKQLPSDYCKITTVEGNVPNVTFDLRYFDTRPEMLPYYPLEFQKKYEDYKDGLSTGLGRWWVELDSPNSFAIKCNDDILEYPIPPFMGLLREIFEIEDYKQLKHTKTELENYAMIAMTLPMDEDGNWGIDLGKAKGFWSNLDATLPEEVGSILTPMPLQKISFEKSNTGDTDTVSEAENNMFTEAGVSSLLFNNEKASANALQLSIKADQGMTYGIVKSIEDALNRYIHAQSYGKQFSINILDVSPYNRKEVGDAYLKAASYGLPTISAYAASQGIEQAQVESMNFLEENILGLQNTFRPLQNSAQLSSADLESNAATDEGGAPTKEIGEVSDSREVNSELE